MNLTQLRICVIDDEKPIRQALVQTLNKSPQFIVVGEAESVKGGAEIILSKSPDAIFLDVKLREGDAFQLIDILRRKIDRLPPIIINTGYRDFNYAQRLFNRYKDCVISILEKPFWEDWHKKESEIIDKIFAHKSGIDKNPYKIVIKSDYKSYILEPDEIMYFEVDRERKPVKITMCTIDKEVAINKSLSELQSTLPKTFLRVSRFLIINLTHIDYYDHSDHVLFLKGFKRNFSVGKAYEQHIFDKLIS